MQPRVLTQTLLDLAREVGEKEAVTRFTSFLAARRSLHMVPAVLSLLEAQTEAEKETQKIHITTAHPVSQDLVKRIVAWMDAEGVEVESEVNSDLIAGFRATFNNRLYDASFRTKLNALEKHITK